MAPGSRNHNPTYPDEGVCAPEALPDGLVQVLGPEGELVGESALSAKQLVPLHEAMVRQRLLDDRMLQLQRQGRIGFYGACTGQEASVFGTTAAVQPTDWIVPALREAGALLYRGLSLRDYFNQLLGNSEDITQGRQMPCHPPGHDFHYITMSSCIANQIPQANGLALAGKIREDGRVTLCFMGDGATSEGDFHVGLNVAAVKQLPVVFICQNNQWSISLPVGAQTAATSMAIKAKAYDMPGVRVDGNDILAVHKVTTEAADRARAGQGPSFIECLTYRLGAHTTSDDPTRYRDENVTGRWWELDPILRSRRYLEAQGLWSEEREAVLRSELDQEIRSTWNEVEKVPAPSIQSIFDDVFAEPSPQLREQASSLKKHLEWAKNKGLEPPSHH